MKIGISTACYYPLETEKALQEVVECGSQCTELFLNSFYETSPEYVRELRSILNGSGTSVTSTHPFLSGMEPMLFFGDYKRRFNDGMDMYKRFFEVTAELGGGYVVFHGAFSRHPMEYDDYIERYACLHEAAKGFGVRVAQENVGRCMSRDPKLLSAMREAIPDVAFVLDIKQTFRGEGDIDDVMDAMGDNIRHLHYSDARVGSDCLPVGEGCFDFAHLLDRLHGIAYKGDAVLELYRENYTDNRQLWHSVERLRSIMSQSGIDIK